MYQVIDSTEPFQLNRHGVFLCCQNAKNFLIKIQMLLKISSRWQIGGKKRFQQCSKSWGVGVASDQVPSVLIFVLAHIFNYILILLREVLFVVQIESGMLHWLSGLSGSRSLSHTRTQFPVKEAIFLNECNSLLFHIL